MSEILEIIMLICFGCSWPANLMKSYKARTTKGKSLLFLTLIEIGYLAGIASKIARPDFKEWFDESWYVIAFYALNFIMVGTDVIIYFRNKKLDKLAENK